MDHAGGSAAPQPRGPEVQLLGGKVLLSRDEVERETKPARDRRQELADLPDLARRWLAIASSERYRTYALALLLLREASAAETFEAAFEAADLADAIAQHRLADKPSDRMAADIGAAARLALARWAKTPAQLEASWADLQQAKALANEGTGDAELAAALLTEWASWLVRVGCLEFGARQARRASRLWQALGEEQRAANANELRSLAKLEVRKKCSGEPAQGLPEQPLENKPWLLSRLRWRKRFADAWELLAAERGALAAASCAGKRP